ncbi:MAG: glutaredoxin family protein [Gammaproteobacteria bacterium]|nr:MAG: glutaredoxin family protein [Gammaproteobacteria bacterium]
MRNMIIVSFCLLVFIALVTRGGGETQIIESYNGKVVLYATDQCGYCRKAINHLNKLDIEYIGYDINKSAIGRREFDQLGGRGVPLMIIDGQLVRGYNPRAISQYARKHHR